MKKISLYILFLVGILAVLSMQAFAAQAFEQYYAGPENDGMALRDWAAPPAANWVELNGQFLDTSYDGWSRRWSKGLIHIPISGLAGRTLDPGSATLWLYVVWSNNLTVEVLANDPGPTPQWGEINASRTWVATINGVMNDWVGIDVTDQLQSLINSNAGYIGFLLGGGEGSVCAAESGLVPHIEVPAAEQNVVPEPSSLLALLAGIPAVGFLRRKR